MLGLITKRMGITYIQALYYLRTLVPKFNEGPRKPRFPGKRNATALFALPACYPDYTGSFSAIGVSSFRRTSTEVLHYSAYSRAVRSNYLLIDRVALSPDGFHSAAYFIDYTAPRLVFAC